MAHYFATVQSPGPGKSWVCWTTRPNIFLHTPGLFPGKVLTLIQARLDSMETIKFTKLWPGSAEWKWAVWSCYIIFKASWVEMKLKKKKKKEDVLVSIKSLTHYCPSWTWNRLSWHHWRSRCRWHWWRGQKCSQSWRSRGWQGLLDDETCKRSKF